jgi:hypothetical protein
VIPAWGSPAATFTVVAEPSLCSVIMQTRRLRAVLFDVDFTLSRPGPELGPEAYRRVGNTHGLSLDPERYEAARIAAFADLRINPELEHDEEIWIAFTEDIVRGMGGISEGARACAVEIVRRWEIHANFDLYDDAIPVLEALRTHGLRIGLISNGNATSRRSRGITSSTSTSRSARRVTAGRSRMPRSSRLRSHRSGWGRPRR